MKKNIAVLTSGEAPCASGLVSVFHEGNRVRVALVLTDRENAPVLENMQAHGVETMYIPREVWSDNPQQVIEILRNHGIDMIVVDGFGSLIPQEILDAMAPFVLGVKTVEKNDGQAKALVLANLDSDSSGETLLEESLTLPDTGADASNDLTRVARSLLGRAVIGLFSEAERREAAANQCGVPPGVATPPPVPPATPPSLDERWAETLKVKYEPERIAQPNPSVQDVTHTSTPTNVPDNPEGQPPMPPSYIVWSVLCTVLCCFIPGIIAIIYSSQVSSKYYSGDYDGARRSSRNAELWIIVSFVLGVLSSTLYLPFMLMSDGILG